MSDVRATKSEPTCLTRAARSSLRSPAQVNPSLFHLFNEYIVMAHVVVRIHCCERHSDRGKTESELLSRFPLEEVKYHPTSRLKKQEKMKKIPPCIFHLHRLTHLRFQLKMLPSRPLVLETLTQYFIQNQRAFLVKMEWSTGQLQCLCKRQNSGDRTGKNWKNQNEQACQVITVPSGSLLFKGQYVDGQLWHHQEACYKCRRSGCYPTYWNRICIEQNLQVTR